MQVGLFPLVRVDEVEVDDANLLLERWEHPLGACHRPFGVQAHVLALDMTGQGPRPIALTISASTVSETCGGDDRFDLVELARIARHPAEPWALRPMLRIWRQCLAQSWPHWTVSAAVSYALPGTPGDLYRFDGWERVGVVRPSNGGGTWSSAPTVNRIADGRKTLWRWRYAAAPGATA